MRHIFGLYNAKEMLQYYLQVFAAKFLKQLMLLILLFVLKLLPNIMKH